MATCTELYIDTLGGLDFDGSTDKNLPYFVEKNLATLGGHGRGLDWVRSQTLSKVGHENCRVRKS